MSTELWPELNYRSTAKSNREKYCLAWISWIYLRSSRHQFYTWSETLTPLVMIPAFIIGKHTPYLESHSTNIKSVENLPLKSWGTVPLQWGLGAVWPVSNQAAPTRHRQVSESCVLMDRYSALTTGVARRWPQTKRTSIYWSQWSEWLPNRRSSRRLKSTHQHFFNNDFHLLKIEMINSLHLPDFCHICNVWMENKP